MDTCKEIRREKLRVLIDTHGLLTIAKNAGVSGAYLDQIIKRVTLPERKTDKSRAPREVGDSLARKIEDGLELGEGFMDWPFSSVDDFKVWKALDQMQRSFAEGLLSGVFARAAERPRSESSRPGRQPGEIDRDFQAAVDALVCKPMDSRPRRQQ